MGDTFSLQGLVSQLYKQTLLFLISLTVVLTSRCSYFDYHYSVNTGVINNFHYGQGLGIVHAVLFSMAHQTMINLINYTFV